MNDESSTGLKSLEHTLVHFLNATSFGRKKPEGDPAYRQGYRAALDVLRLALRPWYPVGGPLDLSDVVEDAPITLINGSRLSRRVQAAKELAANLAGEGRAREAQIIRDLCNSASASAATNSTLHRDLQTALKSLRAE